MAVTGQTAEHAPQSTHFTLSIARFPLPSAIASTGHSLSQVPQLVQASLITYAILFLSFMVYLYMKGYYKCGIIAIGDKK
jgi:hypothetical protein